MSEEEKEEFFVDILNDLEENKKKKKNGNRKGKNVERELVKVLTAQFNDIFSRVVGSGNRTGQVILSEQAKQFYSGDIVVPEKFRWCFECKGGYEDDINMACVCDGNGISQVDKFMEQVLKDAKLCKRTPMVCWKRNRKPWIAMIRAVDLPKDVWTEYKIIYRDWVIGGLQELFEKTDRNFWYWE